MSQLCAGGTELARELDGAATDFGSPVWSTSQHVCGSAPMGTEGDPRAIVMLGHRGAEFVH